MIELLILSNMGPSRNKPSSGRFVLNQYHAIKNNFSNEINAEYFYLDQEPKKGIAKLLRYPVFFLKFLWSYVFRLKKLDIIHVHFYFPTILLAVFYKLFRRPNVKIVVTFHGSDIYKYIPANAIYRWCNKFVDKHIFVSEELQQKFFSQENGEILSAGILDCFNFKQPDKKSEFKYQLMFAGRLDENKGSKRLISLIEKLPNCQFLVVGDGDYYQDLNKLNVNNLTLIKHATPQQLVKLYKESRFLLNLSLNESFGLVMTEAMACGTPVIATKTDGSTAQIRDDETGYLVENDECWLDENLANFINDRLNSIDFDDYIKISKAVSGSAQPYRLSVISNRLADIYFSLAAKGS